MFTNNSSPFTMNVEPAGSGNGFFGDGNGSWIWLIVILVLLFGNNGWGNGYGYGGGGYMRGGYDMPVIVNAGGYGATGFGGQAGGDYILASDISMLSRQMSDGFNNQERRTDAIINGVSNLGYTQQTLANNIMTQMSNNAVNQMKDVFALQTQMNNNTNALTAQMTANEAARQACCCATDTLIGTSFGNLKYDMAAQDCATRQTINDVGRNLADVGNDNTRAILAAIQSIKDDAKDEKIASLQAQLSDAKVIANNNAQTTIFTNAINAAVERINPCPIPAYTVNPPYQYTGCGCHTCGC